jgi:hypothetical protein
VGTGEVYGSSIYFGAGILQSTDAGVTWTQQGAGIFAPQGPTDTAARIGAMAVDPFNSQIVLAGTSGGLYRTIDGGSTWTLAPALAGQGTGLAFDGNNSGVVYAAISQSTAAGIYRSTDHGVTWARLGGSGGNLFPATGVGYIALSVVSGAAGAAGSATLYSAVTQGTSLRGVWKSSDSGANWTQLRNTPDFCAPLCGFATAIAADPANPDIVFAAGTLDNFAKEFIRSTDGGNTWMQVGCQLPGAGICTLGSNTVSLGTDYHALVFTADGSRLYMGNDQGVWRTENPDVADFRQLLYTDLNSGLVITQQFGGHAISPSDENVGFVGAQDTGTARYSGGMAWDKVFSEGDGGEAAIDQQIPSVVYTTSNGSCAGRCIARSFFDGTSISSFLQSTANGITVERTHFPAGPLTVDPNIAGRVYYGTFRVYLTTDFAETWTPISPDLTGGGTLATIAVAPSDSNVVYAATTAEGGGKVQKCQNALQNTGAQWTDITSRDVMPTGRDATAIAVDKNHSDLVYVTYDGFASGADIKGQVFRSPDGGATWEDITGNLPHMPVHDVVADPDVADTLYIGTANGVWTSANASAGAEAEWSRLGGTNTPGSLPNVAVMAVNLRSQSRILRALTHGRGTWTLPLTNLDPPAGPVLMSMHPSFAAPGASLTGVTLDGLNFTSAARVQFDGSQNGVTTHPGGSAGMTVDFDASRLTPGMHRVSVADPSQAPGVSKELLFSVYSPTPVLVRFVPASLPAGGSSFTMTVTGRNFICNGGISDTVLYFGSTRHKRESSCVPSPTSGGDMDMTVTIDSSEIRNTGPVTVTLVNPPPGGGTSLRETFQITAAAPAKPSANESLRR